MWCCGHLQDLCLAHYSNLSGPQVDQGWLSWCDPRGQQSHTEPGRQQGRWQSGGWSLGAADRGQQAGWCLQVTVCGGSPLTHSCPVSQQLIWDGR